MSDRDTSRSEEAKPTSLIERDKLRDLLDASCEPDITMLAHTVPREHMLARGSRRLHVNAELTELDLTDTSDALDLRPSTSPLLVLAVLGIFIGLFVAVVRLG